MALNSGTHLGLYAIVSPIGAGGMGEVYKALDTQLGREVAIKVLPEAFEQDRERLARFEREARILASLNHPNVATLYGLEQSGGIRFLVMELVPGETLAERLARGPIPTEEALPLFKHIAEGLQAAHEESVIHRDLKPANIMITPDGTPKILDFGLAKTYAGQASSSDLSESPTATKGTATGVVLGTPSYMSPEQAKGKPLDRRADVWAFGCCLFEALSGRKAFHGETLSDVLASVIKDEPDWDVLPALPSGIERLLRRCLQKDPARRLHDIADGRLEIEEAMEGTLASEDSPRRTARGRLGWILAAFLAGASISALLLLSRPSSDPAGELRRLEISLTPAARLAISEQPPLAISPDGNVLVYAGTVGDTTHLFQRRLDEWEAIAIPDTDGAHGPFFSPDGESVFFFTGMELRRVKLTGGASQRISDAPPVPRGASFTSAGEILITPTNAHGLARGFTFDGSSSMLAPPDPSRNERNHSWSQGLPDGKSALVTVHKLGRESYESADVAILDLETGTRTVLLEGAYHARYVPTGHLVYMSGGVLNGVPVSLSRAEVTGPPVPLVRGVMADFRTGAAYYAFSDSGTLVYAAGGAVSSSQKRLVWVDLTGRSQPVSEETRVFSWPRISPDSGRVAVAVEGASDDLWIYELARGTFERFTFEARNITPLWTPDGRRLIFSTTRNFGVPQLVFRRTDGIGEVEQLVSTRFPSFVGSWTPDGQSLAFTRHGNRDKDIMLKSFEDESPPVALLDSRFDETGAAFSPDGRSLAYVSDESGRGEVYVRAFPGPGTRVQLSTDGGDEPVWAKSGHELFYRSDSGMMGVAVDATDGGGELRIGESRLLFDDRFEMSSIAGLANYDVSSDGRFLMVEPYEENKGPTQLYVVLNWFEELERRVPSDP